jgi:hypothetical protein
MTLRFMTLRHHRYAHGVDAASPIHFGLHARGNWRIGPDIGPKRRGRDREPHGVGPRTTCTCSRLQIANRLRGLPKLLRAYERRLFSTTRPARQQKESSCLAIGAARYALPFERVESRLRGRHNGTHAGPATPSPRNGRGGVRNPNHHNIEASLLRRSGHRRSKAMASASPGSQRACPSWSPAPHSPASHSLTSRCAISRRGRTHMARPANAVVPMSRTSTVLHGTTAVSNSARPRVGRSTQMRRQEDGLARWSRQLAWPVLLVIGLAGLS